ncbi:CoB--CoM heterodisulfide reductase iron-sulfur subunit A family protein [Methanolacinia paynteri]|uniref:CoB--CoM heterodisulfide reductase iron-sulfur subunit A family protein n=1 Tax=Methanolacinia paynteri TaxID=230356 RepID=UPI000693CA63|nr:CoB--CoM heterodisulfide reductase iron-sulfur subunit A family protein [Methanolacinia paynteri]
MRKVAVIGAGITGIQAALDLSRHGIEVHLIEKEPYIGGHVAQLGRIFPTGDWSACILASKINEVLRAPGITLHTMTEVTGLEGEPGNFTLHLRKHPRFVDADKCTGCCACSDVCPVELYNEFDAGLGVRKAIYKPYNEAVPIAAIRDSDHCINCNLCFDACPNDAVLRNDEDGITDLSIQEICSVVVSTGYRMYDPRNEPRYRYLAMPDVITSLEFERMISPDGPTGGEIRRLSNGKIPKSIVFVQCVGSRNIAVGRNFCSAVCCMYTIKNAGLVKEKYGDSINVTILKAETRAYGKDYQEYNHRIKQTYEIKVLRCTPGSIEYGEGNRMRIVAEKVKKGFPETPIVVLEPELVVLAAGMAPSKDVESISRIMGLDRSSVDGFFCPNEQVLDPTGTPRPGIYIAGTAIAPKDINDCVNQAEAVSMKVFVDAYSD